MNEPRDLPTPGSIVKIETGPEHEPIVDVRKSLHERIEWDHAHHAPPNSTIANTHACVRTRFIELAHEMIDLLPLGRDQTLCLTAIEVARQWANAAVAKQPDGCGELS